MDGIFLETGRLQLRWPGPDDAATMHRFQGDPDTLRGWPRTYSITEIAAMLRRTARHYRDHWGRGNVTEAAAACVDFAFDRLGATRVIARIMYDNAASRRVAEKLGMRPAGWTTWIVGIPHIVYERTRG